MKVGDLVTTKSRNFIGVIIDSEQVQLRGRDVNSHHVYWSDSKVEKNPVWVKERDLVRAV